MQNYSHPPLDPNDIQLYVNLRDTNGDYYVYRFHEALPRVTVPPPINPNQAGPSSSSAGMLPPLDDHRDKRARFSTLSPDLRHLQLGGRRASAGSVTIMAAPDHPLQLAAAIQQPPPPPPPPAAVIVPAVAAAVVPPPPEGDGEGYNSNQSSGSSSRMAVAAANGEDSSASSVAGGGAYASGGSDVDAN